MKRFVANEATYQSVEAALDAAFSKAMGAKPTTKESPKVALLNRLLELAQGGATLAQAAKSAGVSVHKVYRIKEKAPDLKFVDGRTLRSGRRKRGLGS